jgi:hypothetical protein
MKVGGFEMRGSVARKGFEVKSGGLEAGAGRGEGDRKKREENIPRQGILL